MEVLFLASVPQSPSWTRAKSDIGQETRNRAKGNLKCVPKTIMGPEDCASPHVSFLLKCVRAQVHLWNIHTLSLSDLAAQNIFCRIGSFAEISCIPGQSPYCKDLHFLYSACVVPHYDDLVYLLQRLLKIFASQINICVLYPLLHRMGSGNRHVLSHPKTPHEIGLRQECIISACFSDLP